MALKVESIKLIKQILIWSSCLLLVACGHGYEGSYQTQAKSTHQHLNSFAGNAEQKRVVIGRDYIEVNGERTKLERIFVENKGSERYLVLQKADEQSWLRIIDEQTLAKGNGLLTITFRRVPNR